MMILNYFNPMTTQSAFRKAILIGGVLPIFITGCTGLSGTQPPAPVYSGNRPYDAPIPKQMAIPPKAKVDDVVQVAPLAEFTPIVEEAIELKAEPIATPTPSVPPTVDWNS
jgi:hypothetical protein